MPSVVEVRHGSYYDSVSLMQVSKAVSQVPGVHSALVAMATELNLDLLAGMGFVLAEAAGTSEPPGGHRGQRRRRAGRRPGRLRRRARDAQPRHGEQRRGHAGARPDGGLRGPPPRRDPGAGLGAGAARLRRGDGRPRRRPVGDGVQRQRAGRGRDRPQGHRGRPGPARDGARLWHRGGRRRRPRASPTSYAPARWVLSPPRAPVPSRCSACSTRRGSA